MPELTPLPRPAALKRSARNAPAAAPPRRRRWVKYAFIFITVAVLVNAIAGERGLVQAWRLHRENAQLAGDIAKLEKENHRLNEVNRRLREDPKAIEEAARRKLGLIRQGERIYVIKDVPSPSSRVPSPSRTAPVPSSSPAPAQPVPAQP